MNWPDRLKPALFLRRENRFRSQVLLYRQAVPAHVPNSGRLMELLVPHARVWVLPAGGGERKTACDLILAEHSDTLVSVDARQPNALVAEALAAGRMPPFRSYPRVQSEVRVGQSRLDFLLMADALPSGPLATTDSGGGEAPPGSGQRNWREVKSVTLVENGVALFPDAPTTRGVRHLQELEQLHGSGDRVAVVFVVQRRDAVAFSPHPLAHPEFAAALRRVGQLGVEVYAWRCVVTLEGSTITDPIPVLL
jgi:sugar fermentation stimulation protein A